VLLFVSPNRDLRTVALAAEAALPDATRIGCTTMGEIGPLGLVSGSISAMGIGGDGFEAAARPIAGLSHARMRDLCEAVEDACRLAGTSPQRAAADGWFALLLSDGLAGREESLLAAIGATCPGLPLAGASAGDDLELIRTCVLFGGEAAADAGVLVLCRFPGAVTVFRTTHCRATDRRLVITRSRPSQLLVDRIDGRPAVDVFSELTGIAADDLRVTSPAALGALGIGFAMPSGDMATIRSVLAVEGDALRLAGVVEEGAVVRVARSGDLVRDTLEAREAVVRGLGFARPSWLLFQCGGRRAEAAARGQLHDLALAMDCRHAAGLHTYGEQFGSTHQNQTLTGVAFAADSESAV
jgi:hypothetical protein